MFFISFLGGVLPAYAFVKSMFMVCAFHALKSERLGTKR